MAHGVLYILQARCAQRIRRDLDYSGAILRFLHVVPMCVKFGVEEWPLVDSFTPNFTPSVQGWGVGPKSEN